MSFSRRVTVLALSLSLALPAGAAGSVAGPSRAADGAGRTATSPAAADGAGAGLAGLPVTALPVVMATLGANDPALAARGYGALAELRNVDAGLALTADPTGLSLTAEAGSLRLSPVALGRGTAMVGLPVGGRPVADANRVTTDRGDLLTEWLINAPSGIEQGFTVAADPAPGTTGALILSLALSGDLASRAFIETRTRLAFTGTTLAWEGLAAWDAQGTVLPALLSLQGDRIHLVVDDTGATYPLTIDPTWVQQASLKASNPGADDLFGVSVAIAGDTIVVGARYEDSCDDGSITNPGDNACTNAGAAYAFTRSGTTWSQQASLKASDSGAADNFGGSVAIAGDTIVVGATGEASCDDGSITNPGDNACSNAGAAYVFTRSGTTWSQQASLKASNSGVNDFFGESVAIAGDTIVVGAFYEASCDDGSITNPGDDGCAYAGAAYVFTRSGTTWSPQASLKASNSGADDFFGYSVAIAGDTIVVGARDEASCDDGSITNPGDDACTYAGAAYVFTRSGTTWSPQASLKASNSGTDDEFGSSVAIAGDTIVVGARSEASCDDGSITNPGDNDCTYAGAAYVFTRSGSSWSQQASLKASNSGGYDFFGGSVAIAGDTVVIGATGEASCDDGSITNPGDDGCAYAGAAYLFIPDTAPPRVRSVRTKPGSPAAGTKVTVTATARDPSGVVSAQVRVGKGKPVAMKGVNGFGRTTQKLTGSIRVPSSGRQSICVRATDGQGNRSPWRCTKVTVTALIPDPSPVPSPDPGSSPVPSPIASPVPSPVG